VSVFQDWERRLLRILDGPLPLSPRPFATIAQRAGISEAQAIQRIREWLADGTIRRFGARVNHRAVGYRANGMSVWKVPEEQIEKVAAFMSALPEISHCYLRPARPGWEYNLFAMIHGTREEEVRGVVERIAQQTGIKVYAVLFSIKEFKKSAPRYFAGETDSSP